MHPLHGAAAAGTPLRWMVVPFCCLCLLSLPVLLESLSHLLPLRARVLQVRIDFKLFLPPRSAAAFTYRGAAESFSPLYVIVFRSGDATAEGAAFSAGNITANSANVLARGTPLTCMYVGQPFALSFVSAF